MLYYSQCNNFIGIVFMKKEFNMVEVKETYLAPVCECIEISSEGILCASSIQVNEGVFDTEGDSFMGEW